MQGSIIQDMGAAILYKNRNQKTDQPLRLILGINVCQFTITLQKTISTGALRELLCCTTDCYAAHGKVGNAVKPLGDAEKTALLFSVSAC